MPPSDPDCFSGTADEVYALCNYGADCCGDGTGVSGSSCLNWGSSTSITVCKGSCMGLNACNGLHQDTYIGMNSCIGDAACFELGLSATGVSLVLEGSCMGSTACKNVGQKAASNSIGPQSCNGDRAFDGVGLVSTGTISIKENSMNGYEAGWDVANTATGDVTIGPNSCTCGNDQETGGCCWGLVYDIHSLETLTVGNASCNGHNACYNFGNYANKATSISIGDFSCNEREACFELGFLASHAKSFDIGDNSCNGEESCYYLGRSPGYIESVTIGTNACTYEHACSYLAFNFDNYTPVDDVQVLHLEVSDNVCTSYEECHECFREVGSEHLGIENGLFDNNDSLIIADSSQCRLTPLATPAPSTISPAAPTPEPSAAPSFAPLV